MKTIDRAKEFYGNAADGYPEWDDLTETEQEAYFAQCVAEGKIVECEFLVNPLTYTFCDEEADPETGYCDEHWHEITTHWRD